MRNEIAHDGSMNAEEKGCILQYRVETKLQEVAT